MSRRDGNPETATHIAADYQKEIVSKQLNVKFRMFFAGLIFATLSFVGAHLISTGLIFLKIFEILALLLMFVSGVILLVITSGLEPLADKVFSGFFAKFLMFILHPRFYWCCFIIGMFLLIFDRSVLLFVN